MTADLETRSPTRRAVLAGTLAGIGAWAVGALGRANPVKADGETVVIGGNYPNAESLTGILNQTNSEDVFSVASTHQGTALKALSNSGIGANLISNFNAGVWAIGKPAIVAQPSGEDYAIRAMGRVEFQKISGVAVIAAGRTQITIRPGVNMNIGSFLLLTPRSNLGGRDLWFTTDPMNERFTIHLSSARTTATRVSWLLLD